MYIYCMLSRYRNNFFSKLLKTPFAKEAEKVFENIKCTSTVLTFIYIGFMPL